MKINIVYKEEKGWFVGHIQENLDYESQGKTVCVHGFYWSHKYPFKAKTHRDFGNMGCAR